MLQMGGVYTMVHHAGLIVIPQLKMSIISFLLQSILYTTCLTHKLIYRNSFFGFVCLNKLIRKTRDIYNISPYLCRNTDYWMDGGLGDQYIVHQPRYRPSTCNSKNNLKEFSYPIWCTRRGKKKKKIKRRLVL